MIGHQVYATNHAKKWEHKGNFNNETRKCDILFVDAITPNDLFYLFRSIDGGRDWTQLNVYTVTLDPTNPKRIFSVLPNGDLLVSTNEGSTWSPFRISVPSDGNLVIAPWLPLTMFSVRVAVLNGGVSSYTFK